MGSSVIVIDGVVNIPKIESGIYFVSFGYMKDIESTSFTFQCIEFIEDRTAHLNSMIYLLDCDWNEKMDLIL